jgi:hypothetical protein
MPNQNNKGKQVDAEEEMRDFQRGTLAPKPLMILGWTSDGKVGLIHSWGN